VPHFLTDESPDLIQLDTLAIQTTHFLVKQTTATLTDANTQAHDRVTMNPGHSLYRPNRITFGQGCRNCNLFCLCLGGC
jgi:hypothetical protein